MRTAVRLNRTAQPAASLCSQTGSAWYPCKKILQSSEDLTIPVP